MHPYFEITHIKQIVDIYETLHAYYSLLNNKEFSFAVFTQKIQPKKPNRTNKQTNRPLRIEKKLKLEFVKNDNRP